MKSAVAAIAIILLAGCVSQNVGGQSPQASFSVARNYQAVYRDLRSFARSCYETGLITGAQTVDTELFTDIQQGEISVSVSGGLGKMPMWALTVTGAGNQATVTVNNPGMLGSTQLGQLRQAAEGRPPSC